MDNIEFARNCIADRIGGSNFGKDTKLYKFAKIKLAKAEAKKEHPDMSILDFGVGEPDDMAPEIVRQEIKKQVDVLGNRFYTDNGLDQFKQAVCEYMKKVYDVELNWETQVNHCIGEKPAIAMLPLALVNPGDNVIMTVPGYPVFGTHTEYIGGNVINLPLKEENNFYPDLDSLDSNVLSKTKAMVINYPNNPTGKGADRDFLKKAVDFARKNNIILIHDAAYASLVFKERPLSILSIEGAMEVAIELHSLSKAFNMTGWRLGWVCGNPLLVKAFATIKDNIDSGQFAAIQLAGIKALENPDITEEISKKYKRRLEKLVKILSDKGFNARMPDGTFYLYVKAPKSTKDGIQFGTGEDFSQYLIKQKLISTVPWDDAGPFIRFSATFEAPTIEQEDIVLKELSDRLSDLDFIF